MNFRKHYHMVTMLLKTMKHEKHMHMKHMKNICIPIMTTFEKKQVDYHIQTIYSIDLILQRGNKHDVFTHTGVLIRK